MSRVKPIRRLLIANRGEIARRIIRTAHRMGIATVAVYSDADAQALHVREATFAVALGGNGSSETYLRIDKLIAAAKASGADAVHPGYGFLSENADFAQAAVDAGLTWVGPPPEAIRTLGNKSSARQLALARDVPCLPGYQGEDQSDARFADEARCIGFPVMVKAAAGGGGRGMRLVSEPAQLAAALASARSEAQAAFGSGQLLLERAVLAPRHVEVQVFADAHGHCIHLGERDCSVQRRHQKIIEETPSPAVDAALRERMGRCAVELAQAAGYVGAGTVEFLLDGSAAAAEAGGTPFFMMEMNTRLQVEHPVTEAVTGLDLVEWQLRIAQGEPLPLAQQQVRFEGHAIEVRLCAEDENFTPRTGTVLHFREPEGLRFDHAICEGMRVAPHYDSLLGKLIAHAPNRDRAIEQLAGALDRTELLGLPTNRRMLAACLRHPAFRSGAALIPFIEQHGGELRRQLEQQEEALALDGGLAALYGASAGASQTLTCSFERPLRLRHRGQVITLQVRERRGGTLEVQRGGESRIVTPPAAVCVALDDGSWHLHCGAVDLVIEDASFEPAGSAGRAGTANELRAPFNGRVIAVQATPGASVARGDTLLVLESMKLEHALAASRDGVVRSVHVAPGQQAATSQVLVTFEPVP
jgi:3-methylcrotonyl-CoA carboxylase alpha subunit/geranyl-CoA carboxylase alpha subunit